MPRPLALSSQKSTKRLEAGISAEEGHPAPSISLCANSSSSRNSIAIDKQHATVRRVLTLEDLGDTYLAREAL